MRRLAYRPVGALFVLAALFVPRAASADPNDIVLNRFLTWDPTTKGFTNVDQTAFRTLVSELGMVLAPAPMSPAQTLGWSGFEITTSLGWTTINSSAVGANGMPVWRALQSADPMTGAGAPGVLPTFSVKARKGLWLPVPSFEVGAGMTHILSSQMYAMDLDGKVALNEGYSRWPLPALAVRGAVTRLTGSTQLDLTVASVDVSVSKLFGIGGTWSLTPFGGWNYLFIIPRSQVIDATPGVDAYMQGTGTPPDNSDLKANFVFPNQSTITRQRLFLGLKAQYYKLAVLAEAQFILAGKSTSGNITVIPDNARSQQSYIVSLALDF
jgi:hypothetical protein